MIRAKNWYGANDLLSCPACGDGRMRVSRRTPDLMGNPAYEVQNLRCSSCGRESRRLVDANGRPPS